MSKPEGVKAISMQIGFIDQPVRGFNGEQGETLGLLHGDRDGCDP